MCDVSNSAGVRTSSRRGPWPESISSRSPLASTVAGRAVSEGFISPLSGTELLRDRAGGVRPALGGGAGRWSVLFGSGVGGHLHARALGPVELVVDDDHLAAGVRQ